MNNFKGLNCVSVLIIYIKNLNIKLTLVSKPKIKGIFLNSIVNVYSGWICHLKLRLKNYSIF